MPGHVSDALSYVARCDHDREVFWCDGQKDHLACTLLSCHEVLHLLPQSLAVLRQC